MSMNSNDITLAERRANQIVKLIAEMSTNSNLAPLWSSNFHACISRSGDRKRGKEQAKSPLSCWILNGHPPFSRSKPAREKIDPVRRRCVRNWSIEACSHTCSFFPPFATLARSVNIWNGPSVWSAWRIALGTAVMPLKRHSFERKMILEGHRARRGSRNYAVRLFHGLSWSCGGTAISCGRCDRDYEILWFSFEAVENLDKKFGGYGKL